MRKRQSGLTLIEVVIASIILAVLTLMVFLLLQTASTQAGDDSMTMSLEERARQILDDISKDLRMAKGDTIVFTPITPAILPTSPTPHAWAGMGLQTRIQFDMMATTTGAQDFNFTSKTPNYNRRVIYRLQLEKPHLSIPSGGSAEDSVGGPTGWDNVDNDRDVMIDESEIVKTEQTLPGGTPLVTKIGGSVRAFGFTATGGNPNVVNLFIELQGLDNKRRLVTRMAQTSVSVRN